MLPIVFDLSRPIREVISTVLGPGHAPEHKNSLGRVAATLAAERPLQDLVHTVVERGTEPAARELLARWTQESVLRGKPVDEAREVRAFWSGLDHPLAVLPLRLAPVERGLWRWVWRFDRSGGSDRSTPPPPVHVAHHRDEPGAETLAGERDLDAEAILERVGLAPATVYVTSSPLAGHHPDRRLLFDLGLEPLAETARRRVRHHRITAADAIERLFSVAHGVMRGTLDADVRLQTWQSVAALLGGPLEAAMGRAAASDWSWVTGFVPRDCVSLGELGLLVIAAERTRVGAITTWLTD